MIASPAASDCTDLATLTETSNIPSCDSHIQAPINNPTSSISAHPSSTDRSVCVCVCARVWKVFVTLLSLTFSFSSCCAWPREYVTPKLMLSINHHQDNDANCISIRRLCLCVSSLSGITKHNSFPIVFGFPSSSLKFVF